LLLAGSGIVTELKRRFVPVFTKPTSTISAPQIYGKKEDIWQKYTDYRSIQWNRLAFGDPAGSGGCQRGAQQLIQRCEQEFGGLDALINNAGIGAMGRFDQATPGRMRQIFEVNFFALAELVRISLPMLKRGSDPIIVNISSVLGHRGAPLKSEYCASKFAVHGFSDSIRAELAADGVEVLLVSPSTTDSEFFDASIEDQTNKDWKKRGAMSPEIVAAKTIRAMRKRRHEIILTFGGRILVWFDRLIPGLANRLMAKFGQ